MAVIFISRGTMSGVHLLMDCLCTRSKVRCISREDLEKDVNRYGRIATRVLQKLTQASTAYEQFSELRWPYMVLMRKAMLGEVRRDNTVYHGFSSHLLLPLVKHFVRVRIDAPFDMRLTMTMERLTCDERKAREYITRADKRRVKWARFMFAQDIRNTMLYDFHVNLGRVSLNAACGILEHILSEEDFQATPESQAEVERLYLASCIETALVTDPRTASKEISAEVQDHTANLIGPYLEDPELKAVLEIARQVPGIEGVRYAPGYAPKFDMNGPPRC